MEGGYVVLTRNKVDWDCPRVRGVICHELGHHYSGHGPSIIATISSGGGILNNQLAEIEADRYASNLGYGLALADQLEEVVNYVTSLGGDSSGLLQRIEILRR